MCSFDSLAPARLTLKGLLEQSSRSLSHARPGSGIVHLCAPCGEFLPIRMTLVFYVYS